MSERLFQDRLRFFSRLLPLKTSNIGRISFKVSLFQLISKLIRLFEDFTIEAKDKMALSLRPAYISDNFCK